MKIVGQLNEYISSRHITKTNETNETSNKNPDKQSTSHTFKLLRQLIKPSQQHEGVTGIVLLQQRVQDLTRLLVDVLRPAERSETDVIRMEREGAVRGVDDCRFRPKVRICEFMKHKINQDTLPNNNSSTRPLK